MSFFIETQGKPDNNCPVCKDKNIFVEDDYMGEGVIAHYMKCEKCESQWTDTYQFVETGDVEASDKSNKIKEAML